MTETNKRKHSRTKSLNLLAYVCMDENQNVVRQGMGRTLDVSEGGILIETHAPIDLQHRIILTIGLEDDMTEISGNVAYSRIGKSGKYESGIEFDRDNEAALQILKVYIRAFFQQRKQA
jgi:hypothetical protein